MKSLLKKRASAEGKSGAFGVRRFVLMGPPRGGTTYLTTHLNCRPDIYSAGEPYIPSAVFDQERDECADPLRRQQSAPWRPLHG